MAQYRVPLRVLDHKREIDEFARADGFEGWPAMRAWFEARHGLPFIGLHIEWTDFVSSLKGDTPCRET